MTFEAFIDQYDNENKISADNTLTENKAYVREILNSIKNDVGIDIMNKVNKFTTMVSRNYNDDNILNDN